MITVANLAGLALVNGASDGDLAYVQTVKGYFVYALNSPETVDGRYVTNTLVGGTTRWVFDSTFSHPDWRLQRNDWYIDSAGGNDENDGLTAATAIQTGLELYRRWGAKNLVSQLNDSNYSINIHILNDIIKPDMLILDCVVSGDTEIRILGEGTTTASSGTLTGVTAENQTTNQAWQITDSSVATWTPGKRIRFTSGTANGAITWVAKNLGSNAARVSNTALNTEISFGVVPVNKTPAIGNTYVIENLTKLNLGYMHIEQAGNTIDFGANINFIDLELQAHGTNLHVIHAPKDFNNTIITFYQCSFVGNIESYGICFANCLWTAFPVLRKSTFVYGGLTLNTFVEWQAQEEGQIQNDMYVQGGQGIIVGGVCTMGNCAVFDTVAGAVNPGHAIQVGSPGTLDTNIGPAMLKLSGRVWGSGALLTGIRVAAGSVVEAGIAPTITGTAGDFRLGGGGKERAFKETNGTITGVIAATWTKFNQTVAAGGFGGNAHDYTANAHLVTHQ